MKGIILAGGYGTRLFPITRGLSKQFLPVYNKPMIYYALSNLISAGIKEILVISTPEHLHFYSEVLKDIEWFGVKIFYMSQEKPRGIAQAFILAEKWLDGDSVCLHLGDNIFYGFKFDYFLKTAARLSDGALIYTVPVANPADFGVVVLGEDGSIQDIVEKPSVPISNQAIPGIYFFDNTVCEKAKSLTPSARNELEITDLLKLYLKENQLLVASLEKHMAWFDCGTHQSLLQASSFVEAIETRTGQMIGCPEEACIEAGLVSLDTVSSNIHIMPSGSYKNYLMAVLKRKMSA